MVIYSYLGLCDGRSSGYSYVCNLYKYFCYILFHIMISATINQSIIAYYLCIYLFTIGHAEAKLLTTFAEKNQESGQKWNLLSEEEKQNFREKAASTEVDQRPLNIKQQTSKFWLLLHIRLTKYELYVIINTLNYTIINTLNYT